jgi:hypothetical protein
MGMPENPLKREKIPISRTLPIGAADDTPAWEQVEPGRYMPHRIRGSFRGRELG